MIYFDNNATTKPSDRVVDAVCHYLAECYFNPSSAAASFTGADEPRRKAASAIAELLNAEEPDCFVFTSGATESNNWIFSMLQSCGPARIVISAIEHPSVAEPAMNLSRFGFEIVEAPVDENGVVRVHTLREFINQDTALVSIMAANNETGVLQPIQEIGDVIREQRSTAFFHVDATQMIGKLSVDLKDRWSDVDLLSFSAHKFHGPKGLGGVYRRPSVELPPMLRGGGQEDGLRSGTTNVPALAGLAAAIEDLPVDPTQISALRDLFEDALISRWPEAIIHSRGASRLQNTSCFSIPGITATDVAETLASQGIIVGTGAACSAGSLQPSKTLLAMGVPNEIAGAALRVSFSRFNTTDEIGSFFTVFERVVSGVTLRARENKSVEVA